MSWTFVGHVHTRNSFDSLIDPTALVKRAVELGIDVLAVTDHGTWQGSIEARDAARQLGLPLTVIVGSEVWTEQGDVIGLFMTGDLTEKDAPKLCDEIHAQGGLVLLPHPFKWHTLDDELLKRVDLIEVYNGHTGRADNTRAQELAQYRELPQLAGPDAHLLEELGLARVLFEGERPADEAALKHAMLHATRTFVTRPCSIWAPWKSQAVVFARKPTPRDAYQLVRGLVRRIMKPGEYVVG